MNASLQICQSTISGPEVQDAIHHVTICRPVQQLSEKVVDFGGDFQVGSMQSVLGDALPRHRGLRPIVGRQIAVQECRKKTSQYCSCARSSNSATSAIS